MTSHTKKDNRGFSHHFILPVLALVAVGAIGLTTLRLSSAATPKYKCVTHTFSRYTNNPTYSKYAKYKPCVKAIQKKVGAAADGIFGSHTQAKVKAWQSAHKLSADGVVGSKTWAAMGIHPTYTLSAKEACNAKNGYVWASDKCENRKAICTSNGYTWSESKKNCGQKTTATQKKECNARYGYLWVSGKCQNLAKLCKQTGEGTWKDSSKKCVNPNEKVISVPDLTKLLK